MCKKMLVAVFVVSVAFRAETEGELRVGDVRAAADGAFMTVHGFRFAVIGMGRICVSAGMIAEIPGGPIVVRFPLHVLHGDALHFLGDDEKDHEVYQGTDDGYSATPSNREQFNQNKHAINHFLCRF